MPDTTDHGKGWLPITRTAHGRPAFGSPVTRSARWRATSVSAMADAIPATYEAQGNGSRSAAGTARSRVQSGALEAAAVSPGLKAKPFPSTRLRAMRAWIQESSSGRPGSPAARLAASR